MYYVNENMSKKFKTDKPNIKLIKELDEIKKDEEILFKIYTTQEDTTNKMELFEGGGD